MKAIVVLQCPGKWLITVTVKTSLLASKIKKEEALKNALHLIHEAIEQVSEIKFIQWTSEEAFNQWGISIDEG